MFYVHFQLLDKIFSVNEFKIVSFRFLYYCVCLVSSSIKNDPRNYPPEHGSGRENATNGWSKFTLSFFA